MLPALHRDRRPSASPRHSHIRASSQGEEEEEAEKLSLPPCTEHPSSVHVPFAFPSSKIHSCLLFYIDHHRTLLRDRRPSDSHERTSKTKRRDLTGFNPGLTARWTTLGSLQPAQSSPDQPWKMVTHLLLEEGKEEGAGQEEGGEGTKEKSWKDLNF